VENSDVAIVWQIELSLGQGMPLFKNITATTKLKFVESKTFPCGVIAIHYKKS
jgi:hypothetical protein